MSKTSLQSPFLISVYLGWFWQRGLSSTLYRSEGWAWDQGLRMHLWVTQTCMGKGRDVMVLMLVVGQGVGAACLLGSSSAPCVWVCDNQRQLLAGQDSLVYIALRVMSTPPNVQVPCQSCRASQEQVSKSFSLVSVISGKRGTQCAQGSFQAPWKLFKRTASIGH